MELSHTLHGLWVTSLSTYDTVAAGGKAKKEDGDEDIGEMPLSLIDSSVSIFNRTSATIRSCHEGCPENSCVAASEITYNIHFSQLPHKDS